MEKLDLTLFSKNDNLATAFLAEGIGFSDSGVLYTNPKKTAEELAQRIVQGRFRQVNLFIPWRRNELPEFYQTNNYGVLSQAIADITVELLRGKLPEEVQLHYVQ